MYNDEVLYSLMGVNQRLNRIVREKIFTRDLCLLRHCSCDDSTLDRYCSQILPDIGHQIECLFLQGTSIEHALQATNYPNLKSLGLRDVDYNMFISLFGVGFNFAMRLSDGKIHSGNEFVI
jgi:hypothetical protein